MECEFPYLCPVLLDSTDSLSRSKGDILLLSEALLPPLLGGRRRRVGDVGPRQRARSGNTDRTTKHRTPCQSGHLFLLAGCLRDH